MFEAICVFACLLGTAAVNTHAFAALPRVDVRQPRIGRPCLSAGVMSGRTLGDPIVVKMGEPDVPGPHGNEIRQIYRLDTAKTQHQQPVILGWLFASFNGRWMFEPYPLALRNSFVVVNVNSVHEVTGSDVASWYAKIDKSGRHVRSSGIVPQLQACFTKALSK